ncbi:MAG: cyclic nucleotide-binding domain-containing protein [Polyangiaceae bacterium]
MASEYSTAGRVHRSIFVRSLFGSADAAIGLQRIEAMMHPVEFAAGTTIYRRDEASDYLYFILEGSVALDAPGEPRWVFGPRDGFGFLDAMRDRPHARTAHALSDVTALAFSVEDWIDALEDHSGLGRGAILEHAKSVRSKIAALSPDGGFARQSTMICSVEPGDAVGLVERIVMLGDAPCFERAGIQALASLAQIARLIPASPGQLLLEAGAAPTGLYLVGAGVVVAERHEPELSARFGPGSLAMGLSFLGEAAADVTLRSECDSLVLSIREDDFFDVAEDHFDLMRAVFSYMAGERAGLMREIALREQAVHQEDEASGSRALNAS